MEMRAAMTLVALAVTAGAGGCGTLSGLEDYDRVDARQPGEGTTTGGAGAGGAGGAGGTGGTGSAGGVHELPAWKAGEPDAATGTYNLPAWLVLESPSDNKTVQIDAHRLRTGFGPNAARARSVDGSTWGLAVESVRTNRLHTARVDVPPWQDYAGATAENNKEGPDGDLLAALITDPGPGEAAVFQSFDAAAGGVTTISAWVKTGSSQAKLECNSCVPQDTPAIESKPDWQRVSRTGVEQPELNPVARLRPATEEANALGSASFDFVNVEAGHYPSSAIITTGDAATRAAETLYVSLASVVAPDGYFHVVMTFVPYYAADEQDEDHDLFFFDSLNRLYIRAADSAIVLRAAGLAVLETPALTWDREQTLTIELTSTKSGRTLRVAGVSGEDVTVSSAKTSPFPVSGPLYLLGSDTGAQECADLRSIEFFHPI